MNIDLSTWLLEHIDIVRLNQFPYILIPNNAIDVFDESGGGGAHSESSHSRCNVTSHSECSQSNTVCKCTFCSDTTCDDESYSCNCTNVAYYNFITVVTSPYSQIVNEGDRVNLTYSISSGKHVTQTMHQWYYAATPWQAGIAISGANQSTYTFIATNNKDGYYYCVFTSSQGTITSERARITINRAYVYEVWVAAGQRCKIPIDVVSTDDTIPNIRVVRIENSTIATIDAEGMITGLVQGTTSATVNIEGRQRTFTINVIESPLQALFQTTAEILRDKNESINSYAPFEFAAETAKTIEDFDR